MTDRPDVEGTTDPDHGESPFVEAPFLAQGEVARPAAPVFHGAFRWLVLAQGFSAFAFFAYYGRCSPRPPTGSTPPPRTWPCWA